MGALGREQDQELCFHEMYVLFVCWCLSHVELGLGDTDESLRLWQHRSLSLQS